MRLLLGWGSVLFTTPLGNFNHNWSNDIDTIIQSPTLLLPRMSPQQSFHCYHMPNTVTTTAKCMLCLFTSLMIHNNNNNLHIKFCVYHVEHSNRTNTLSSNLSLLRLIKVPHIFKPTNIASSLPLFCSIQTEYKQRVSGRVQGNAVKLSWAESNVVIDFMATTSWL